jgi:hypothetical protein
MSHGSVLEGRFALAGGSYPGCTPDEQNGFLASIRYRGGQTADPSASLGACDFFDLAFGSWPENWEGHLPTNIAGVLRLRAVSRSLCDRTARRFAQDDGFA